MTLQRFASEDLRERHLSGFAPAGFSRVEQVALGASTFLLDAGGQDYVGKNSYDDTGRVDE